MGSRGQCLERAIRNFACGDFPPRGAGPQVRERGYLIASYWGIGRRSCERAAWAHQLLVEGKLDRRGSWHMAGRPSPFL
eukprot:6461115-Amphidinium_carterae.2